MRKRSINNKFFWMYFGFLLISMFIIDTYDIGHVAKNTQHAHRIIYSASLDVTQGENISMLDQSTLKILMDNMLGEPTPNIEIDSTRVNVPHHFWIETIQLDNENIFLNKSICKGDTLEFIKMASNGIALVKKINKGQGAQVDSNDIFAISTKLFNKMDKMYKLEKEQDRKFQEEMRKFLK